MSQTQTTSRTPIQILEKLQACCLVALAALLPISLTLSWVALIAGLVVWLLLTTLSFKEGAYDVPVNNSGNAGTSFLSRLFSATGLNEIPFLKPIFIFVFAVYLSGLFAGGPSEAFKSLITLQTFIVYPWAFQAIKRDPKAGALALAILLLVGSLSCIYAPIEQVFKIETKYLQGTGFLKEAVVFAGQVQILAMVSAAIFLCEGYKFFPGLFKSRWISLIFAVATAIGVVCAAERNAWLGAIIGFLFVCRSVSKILLVASVLSLTGVAAVATVFVPVVKMRVMPLLSGQLDAGITARFEIWKKSLELFKSSPFTGVGIKNFPHLPMDTAMPGKGYFDHAHSNPLHILATTGIVGLAAYVYLIFKIFSLANSLTRTEISNEISEEGKGQKIFDRAIAVGLLATTAALFISGLFEYNFGTGHVRLTYFFVLAYLCRKNF